MSYIGKSPADTLINTNDVDPNSGIVVLNGTQVMTGTKVADNSSVSVTGGSTYNFSGTDQIVELTLTGAGVISMGVVSGLTPKAFYMFMFKAGDTASRTYSWNATYWKFPSADVGTLSTATTISGAYDVITFVATSTTTLAYVGHVEDVR